MHHKSLSKSFLEHAGYFFFLLIVNGSSLFLFSNNTLESTAFLFFLSPLRVSVSHSPPRCWCVICPGPGWAVTLSTYIMFLFGAMTACFPHCSDVIQTRVTWNSVSRVCGPHRLPLPSWLPAEAGLQVHTVVNKVLWTPSDWQCGVFLFKRIVHLLLWNIL